MRIRVWKDPKKEPVMGELVGHTPLSELITLEEYLETRKLLFRDLFKDSKDKDFELMWKMAQTEMRRSYVKVTTPKIVLDDGEIVYGCGVWWEECQSEK